MLSPFRGIKSPFRGFFDWQIEMNRMMAEAFRGPAQMPTIGPSWTPAVDVITRDNDMVIRAKLPGMNREDVNVSLQNGTLTISGEHKEEEERKEENYLVKERLGDRNIHSLSKKYFDTLKEYYKYYQEQLATQ